MAVTKQNYDKGFDLSPDASSVHQHGTCSDHLSRVLLLLCKKNCQPAMVTAACLHPTVQTFQLYTKGKNFYSEKVLFRNTFFKPETILLENWILHTL